MPKINITTTNNNEKLDFERLHESAAKGDLVQLAKNIEELFNSRKNTQ